LDVHLLENENGEFFGVSHQKWSSQNGRFNSRLLVGCELISKSSMSRSP